MLDFGTSCRIMLLQDGTELLSCVDHSFLRYSSAKIYVLENPIT